MSFKRKTKVEHNFGTGVGLGVSISALMSVILAMVVTVLIRNERIGETSIQYITPIIVLISALVGSTLAGKMIGEKIAIVIGVTGIIYLLILIGTGILFFDGGFRNLWTSLISIPVGCVISCAICIRGKKSNANRKRAYR